MKTEIVIGTRESRLAVIQTELAAEFIRLQHPELSVTLLAMKTTGDKILDRTLDQIGGKGLFVKELDQALLDGRSDLSVHSLKDMPMEVPEELPVLCFSEREDPRDVMVYPKGASEPDFSKPIGSSSIRRTMQVRRIYPQASFASIRGNVQTRLKKLDEGEYGALILAAAGLKRLGLEERIGRFFEPEELIPAAGQGILAVQGRKGEEHAYLNGFGNEEDTAAALAERAFVRTLNGGCSSPTAAFARVTKEGELLLRGLYYDPADEAYITGTAKAPLCHANRLGEKLAGFLKEAYAVMRTGEKGFLGELSQRSFWFDADAEVKRTELSPGTGKVWLVGAGPGDPGLLTLKGLEVLEKAETVVFDALVGQGILTKIPESARCISVGKRAGHHTQPQSEINQILAREALLGRRVVRLKGGDPFLFGRGGEELELLSQFEIPYEVVPGVTSALAVPAYNGIPVTHREFASSLHIITGHKRRNEGYDIDFEALVRIKGTLVFLMGISALEYLCNELMKAGMPENMPAAVLQKGTTAEQKMILATVSTLEAEVRRQGVETPAVIVVGEVCRLAEKYAWYERLPLFGKKIVVTRPRELASKMAQRLRDLGAEVLEIPAIRTEPMEQSEPLLRAIRELSSYDWLVFTSPTGVRIFFEALQKEKCDLRTLAKAQLAVLGSGTAATLAERGLYPDLMPEIYDGEALGEKLSGVLKPGSRVLIPRASNGNPILTERLARVPGVRIDNIAAYETVLKSQSPVDERAEFEAGRITCAVFTSASTVRGFAAALKGLDFSKVCAACIGRQTRAAAEELGMKTRMSEKATIDSLTDCVVKLCKETENA